MPPYLAAGAFGAGDPEIVTADRSSFRPDMLMVVMHVLHPAVVQVEGNWNGPGMCVWNQLLTFVTAKRSTSKTTAFRMDNCISQGCVMC